jgi:small subunit ribosomal protein S4
MSFNLPNKFSIMRRLGPVPYFTKKNIIRKKKPGQHGNSASVFGIKTSISDLYTIKLFSKQLVKFNYCLNEKQFSNLIKNTRNEKGIFLYNLINNLELKLGTLVYRAGFVKTIKEAKQLIHIGKFFVNNIKVTNFNYICKKNDLISTNSIISLNFLKTNIKKLPNYLSFNSDSIKLINTDVYTNHNIDLIQASEYYY